MTIRSARPTARNRFLMTALSSLFVAALALVLRPGAVSAAVPAQTTPGSTIRVNVAALNVRSGPGLSYERIGQVRAGTQLEVVAADDGSQWLQVCCIDGQQGWVLGSPEFVSAAGAAAAEQPAAASAEPVVSSAGTVNLRSGPGTAFSRVGALEFRTATAHHRQERKRLVVAGGNGQRQGMGGQLGGAHGRPGQTR